MCLFQNPSAKSPKHEQPHFSKLAFQILQVGTSDPNQRKSVGNIIQVPNYPLVAAIVYYNQQQVALAIIYVCTVCYMYTSCRLLRHHRLYNLPFIKSMFICILDISKLQNIISIKVCRLSKRGKFCQYDMQLLTPSVMGLKSKFSNNDKVDH